MNECDRRAFLAQAGTTMAAVPILAEFVSAAPQTSGGPLPAAVIGVGRQGRAILGELQKMDAVKVLAICDVDQRRLRSGQRRAPGAKAFADHRTLLEQAPHVQAVFIATPTHEHKNVAMDALAAGRHVYCEAPLASTIEDAQALAAAARNARGVFHTGMHGRSNPIYKLARTFFRSGTLRDLVSMRAQYHRKTTWRTPASDPAREKALNWRLDPGVTIGLAGECGTHQFDVFHWYLDKYPVAVRGGGDIRLHDDGRTTPDTIQCTLEFPGGASLQYHATLANSFEGEYEVFHGSEAAIKLAWTAGWMFKEADAPTQGWEVYANRQQFHNDEGITLIADATKLAAQGRLKEGVGLPNPPLYYALNDFLMSVIDGKPVVCSADEGMRAAIVGISAHRAVTTGAVVPIDEAAFKV